MRKPYASDMTDEQWKMIEPLIFLLDRRLAAHR
jgi:hypothetical protein